MNGRADIHVLILFFFFIGRGRGQRTSRGACTLTDVTGNPGATLKVSSSHSESILPLPHLNTSIIIQKGNPVCHSPAPNSSVAFLVPCTITRYKTLEELCSLVLQPQFFIMKTSVRFFLIFLN